MELEFDKEIDAILRKARGGDGPAAATSPHLGADVIAAFAENALPEKTRLFYVEHFADCDGCRKQLSHTILTNSEAVATAPSTVSPPVAEGDVPWYQSILRTPNLALAMGALILVFSGVLGYLVMQTKRDAQNATVSQVTEQESPRGGPYGGGDALTANSNTSSQNASPANTGGPTANAPAANSTAATPGASANVASGTLGRADASGAKTVTTDGKSLAARGETLSAKSEAVEPPPAPVAMDSVAGERDERKADADKLKEAPTDLELAKRKHSEDRRNRDAPMAAAKTGPSRSGPLQTQSNQAISNAIDMAVTRIVGGKTFNNRSGAWYDSAYRGQATVNHRRGTDEYKKLDKGLRGIAETLGGTVVVVWKEKAYRIQ